jgi:hypothetical protein
MYGFTRRYEGGNDDCVQELIRETEAPGTGPGAAIAAACVTKIRRLLMTGIDQKSRKANVSDQVSDVEKLIATNEIREVMARYARHADHKEFEDLARLSRLTELSLLTG